MWERLGVIVKASPLRNLTIILNVVESDRTVHGQWGWTDEIVLLSDNVFDLQDRIDGLRHQAAMLEQRVTRSRGKLQFDGVELPTRRKTVRIDESRNRAHPPEPQVESPRRARDGRRCRGRAARSRGGRVRTCPVRYARDARPRR